MDDNAMSERAVASAYSLTSPHHAIHERATGAQGFTRPPRPSASRLEASLNDKAFFLEDFLEDVVSKPKDETVLYLAYGSNLQSAKFRGDRGIRPLAQVNVLVPSLRMTFDLPGIPYSEPCFANTAKRDANNGQPPENSNESTGLLSDSQRKRRYRKTAWHKGLVGVVYEVTAKDYAHIIATEGGGSGYQDILVECHPFESSDPKDTVPDTPTQPAFKAHTLFAPRLPEGEEPPKEGGHVQRPDPDYAQASARYLKIITDGAAECELPYEYQDYLKSLRPFTITTWRQRAGQMVFLATWVPFVLTFFTVSRLFTDKKGRLPMWLRQFTNLMFRAVWASYDKFYRPIFGDGERTIGQDDDALEDGKKQMRQIYKESDIEKGAS